MPRLVIKMGCKEIIIYRIKIKGGITNKIPTLIRIIN